MRRIALLAALCLTISATERLFRPHGHFFDKKFRLLVEDFVQKTDVEQQTEIDELLLGVSFANDTHSLSHDFYSTAFGNLKRITPNLEFLNVDGGYVLNPFRGDADELRSEIFYLKEHMKGLITAAQEHRISIGTLTVGVGYLFDPVIADQIGLFELLVREFGAIPLRDAQLYELTLKSDLNGVKIEVAVTVSRVAAQPPLPKGRIPFTTFSRLDGATMDTVARLYFNHIRITGRWDP